MMAARDLTERIEHELKRDKKKFKQNARILIVEDDTTSEPVWEHIIKLSSANAYFDWATTEDEAELLIHQSNSKGLPYDLIISDIFLSGSKTGIDLWHKYQNVLRGKMILISSIEHDKFIKYCGDSDNTPVYIKKPLNISDCIETIYLILKKT